jgi:formylglycine-generating enzyme required for sulfatase activity
MTEASYRLPTEAEWEHACRARVRSAYTFGDEITKEQANFSRNVGKTTEVGAYPANAWDLYDMHGNVWEWCADALRTYDKTAITDPKGSGTGRVLRGGSWVSLARNLRSACRGAFAPDYRSYDIGFRCARVQGPAGQE